MPTKEYKMEIHVNISGKQKVGKTTLALILKRKLEELDIPCEVSDNEDVSYTDLFYNSRIDSLQKRKDLIVKIQTEEING